MGLAKHPLPARTARGSTRDSPSPLDYADRSHGGAQRGPTSALHTSGATNQQLNNNFGWKAVAPNRLENSQHPGGEGQLGPPHYSSTILLWPGLGGSGCASPQCVRPSLTRKATFRKSTPASLIRGPAETLKPQTKPSLVVPGCTLPSSPRRNAPTERPEEQPDGLACRGHAAGGEQAGVAKIVLHLDSGVKRT